QLRRCPAILSACPRLPPRRQRHVVALRCMHAPPPEIYTLSLHDALPILRGRTSHCLCAAQAGRALRTGRAAGTVRADSRARRHRSEEHTSVLQSRENLVCRLPLEKKNIGPYPTLGPSRALRFGTRGGIIN